MVENSKLYGILLNPDDPREAQELRHILHARCPQCLSSKCVEATCVGGPVHPGDFDDNPCACHCGWTGAVDDLRPAGPQDYPDEWPLLKKYQVWLLSSGYTTNDDFMNFGCQMLFMEDHNELVRKYRAVLGRSDVNEMEREPWSYLARKASVWSFQVWRPDLYQGQRDVPHEVAFQIHNILISYLWKCEDVDTIRILISPAWDERNSDEDWEYYVPEVVREYWPELDVTSRRAVYLCAQTAAQHAEDRNKAVPPEPRIPGEPGMAGP